MMSPNDCCLAGGSGAVRPFATAAAAADDFCAAATASVTARLAASLLAPSCEAVACSIARFAASPASVASVWACAASIALSSGLSMPASETPTPGLVRLTAASPMKSANVVTISK